jgi:hypothetical protein
MYKQKCASTVSKFVSAERSTVQGSSHRRQRTREKSARRVAIQVTAKVRDNPFEGWTTIEDAAAIIGRNKTTLYGWASKGWISCFAVGQKVKLVNLEEVREFSEKHSPPRPRSVDKSAKVR